MKTFLIALAAFLIGAGSVALIALDPFSWRAPAEEQPSLYTCPMHPEVLANEPGACPICHMPLVPVEDGGGDMTVMAHDHAGHDHHGHDHAGHGHDHHANGSADGLATAAGPTAGPAVRIDPSLAQTMNLRTAPATLRTIGRRARTVGYLEYDQERMASVTTKVRGFIEDVRVSAVGEPVRRGDPLFEIYAPELVQTQEELLSAIDYARRLEATGGDAHRRALRLVDAARTRLGYWDVDVASIAALEERGEVTRTLTVRAPSSGVIMQMVPGLEGMAVEPGMAVLHLADLSSLWLSAKIYEDQVSWIGPGTGAEVLFDALPGESFRGRVRFLDPEVSPDTRTLGVKLAVPNRDGRLRAGMYATVLFAPPPSEQTVAIPAQAVLRTGVRDLVIVELGDGRYAPREIRLGRQADGWVAIRDGLEVGESVVTSAQFLIDSESNLRAAIERLRAGETTAEAVSTGATDTMSHGNGHVH
ncbi:MAG: efflux RND transporter periplasmic adaptor subunit [Acidobacteriota bacterium]